MASARRLAKESKVDRVVLNGQSSWIPLVRRLFMRPRSEGGFGLAPNKIEFDPENAKAAVAKGACLLRIMRETAKEFDVAIEVIPATPDARLRHTRCTYGESEGRSSFSSGIGASFARCADRGEHP